MRKYVFVSLLVVGIGTTVFAVYIFVSALSAPQNLSPFSSLLCPAGSTITSSTSGYSLPTGESGTNIEAYCVDAVGNQNSVQDSFIAFVGVPWVVPRPGDEPATRKEGRVPAAQ